MDLKTQFVYVRVFHKNEQLLDEKYQVKEPCEFCLSYYSFVLVVFIDSRDIDIPLNISF